MSLANDLKTMLGFKPRHPHAERDLAKAYGLAPDRLKEVRNGQLQRGTHWDLVKGLVCYSEDGKTALEAALAISAEKNPAPNLPPAPAIDEATGMIRAPDGPLSGVPDSIEGGPPFGSAPADSAPNIPPKDPPSPPKKFVPPKPGEVRTLVTVAKVRNKRILKARDEDRVVWVRVRDSKNFRPGLQLQATFVTGDLWELVGRCPRWNGKF